MLSRNDLGHLIDCLEELGRYQGDLGCNDTKILDTPENRKMLEWASFINDPDEEFSHNSCKGKLNTQSFIITHYLRDKIERLLDFLNTADDDFAELGPT